MAATFLGWDWKSRPELDELQDALKPFGLHVYEDPDSEGSDWFGYVISDKALDKAELEAVSKTQYEDEGLSDDDEPEPDLTPGFLTRHYLLDPSEYREAPEAALKAVGKFDGDYNSALLGKHPKKGYFVVEAGDNHETLVWTEWGDD